MLKASPDLTRTSPALALIASLRPTTTTSDSTHDDGGRQRATVTASPSPPWRSQDDRHASVEQLSVTVITAIASFCLVNRDTLADIKPSFENDTNIVPGPPNKAAFCNCEKVVERDVEIYRKKSQFV